MIKRNRTWKISSLPGYSLASHCTKDRLHVSLRPVTFCHGVLRSARFITAHYVSHFRRDCRGRFLNCQKLCHGVHSYPGVLCSSIPFPCVASRLSRFAHGCLKRGCRGRREHSINAVLPVIAFTHTCLPCYGKITTKDICISMRKAFFSIAVERKSKIAALSLLV